MGRLIAALLAVLLLAVPGAAQDADLDRVDSLIANGEYAAARSAIEQWWRAVEGGRSVSTEARARAHLLRARLAPDFRSAERDYLAVALGHPTTPYAPQALLALGQGYLASGDIGRAVSYLKRLVDDYPRTNLRPVGLLWAARARRLDGDITGACAAARAGLSVANRTWRCCSGWKNAWHVHRPTWPGRAARPCRCRHGAIVARRPPSAPRRCRPLPCNPGRFARRAAQGPRRSAPRRRIRAATRVRLGSDLPGQVGRFTPRPPRNRRGCLARRLPAVVVNDAHQERQSR